MEISNNFSEACRKMIESGVSLRCTAKILQVSPPLDVANISGKYQRDINDFEWLCRKCHMKKDGRINNFNVKRKDNERDVKGRFI